MNRASLRNIILCLFCISLSTISALDGSIIEISADILHNSGYTGDGEGVCILDNGVYYWHNNLGACNSTQFLSGSCRGLLNGTDIADSDNDPLVLSTALHPVKDHGTAVTGTIISDHPTYTGVAPDANVLFVKIDHNNAHASTTEFFGYVKQGLQWCIDHKDRYNISVISLSIGTHENLIGYSTSNCPDLYNLSPEINTAYQNNIMVVVSSGNSYSPFGIEYPACLSNVVAVGATDENSITSFTSVGDALDLVAPGRNVHTTKTDQEFADFSGTSFATPITAGVALLMRQYDTTLKPKVIEKILKESGKKIGVILGTGEYPKIDVSEALHFNDWPFFLHDLKRSGVTKLKGDIPGSGITISPHNFGVGGTNALDKMGIANVQKNGPELLDIILTVSLSGTQGKVYVASYYDPEWHYGQYVWSEFNLDVLYNTNAGFVGSPTIVDVKGGFLFGGKEVIFSTGDDIVHAISSKESAMEDFYEL